MSNKYKHGDVVPTMVLALRLKDLAKNITKPKKGTSDWSEFYMSIPAQLDRDADLVLGESGRRLLELEQELKAAREETELMRTDCAKYHKNYLDIKHFHELKENEYLSELEKLAGKMFDFESGDTDLLKRIEKHVRVIVNENSELLKQLKSLKQERSLFTSIVFKKGNKSVPNFDTEEECLAWLDHFTPPQEAE